MRHLPRLAAAGLVALTGIACGTAEHTAGPTDALSGTSRTEAPSLVGPTWRLVSLEGRDVVAGTRVTASFESDDRMAGSSGCNRYTGRAAAAEGRLEVGLMAATRMFCGADGVMAQEAAYLDVLGKATSYRLSGNELLLGPRPGVVTLLFRAD